MLEPVAAHIKHVQLKTVTNFGGQLHKAVLPEGQHTQLHQVAHLGGQELQPVAVQVEIGQLGQIAWKRERNTALRK